MFPCGIVADRHVINACLSEAFGLLKLPERTILIGVNCAHANASAFSTHGAHEPVVGFVGECLIATSEPAGDQTAHLPQATLNLGCASKGREMPPPKATRHRS